MLEVLVKKTETIKKELGSLSKVIDDDIERRLEAGHPSPRCRADSRGRSKQADLDAEKKRITEEELEAARERQEDLKAQIERCRSLLETSRNWVGFESEPFRDALSCSLELLGAEPLGETTDEEGRPVWTFPPLDRRAETDPSWAATLDTLRAPRKQEPEARRLAPRSTDPAGRLRGRRRSHRGHGSPASGAAGRPAPARPLPLPGLHPPRSLARLPRAGVGLDPTRHPARPPFALYNYLKTFA